ncbi:hypothetical protein WB980_003303 [Bacillus cereus]
MKPIKKILSLIMILVLSITSFTFLGSTDVQAASNSKRVFLYVGETKNGKKYSQFTTQDIEKFTNVDEFVILPTPHWEIYTDGSNNSYSRALSYIKDTVNTINNSKNPKPVIVGLPGMNHASAPFKTLYPKLQSFINQVDKELGKSVKGFYYNCEYMYNNPGSSFDYNNLTNNSSVKLASDLSQYVKNSLSKPYNFIWVPIYSNAEGIAADTIKRVGYITNRTNIFDEVLLQPNYYFNGTGTDNKAPLANLQGVKHSIDQQQVTFRDGKPAAIKLSGIKTRIGVQMEVDGKVNWGDSANNLSAVVFQQRYQQYVDAFKTFVGYYPISYYGAERSHIFDTSVINSINQFYK